MTADGSHPARVPRGPYAKTTGVREKIAVAATDVFARSGYHAATFKEVAAEAGVSERGVVYHFPTKEALLLAVLDHHEAAIGRSGGVREEDGARTLAWVLRNIAEDPPALAELHTLISAESVSAAHPAHERYRVRYAEFRRFLAGGFLQLHEAGELRGSGSPEALAAGMVALMDGLQLQWLRERELDVPAAIDAYLDAVLVPAAFERMRRHRSTAAHRPQRSA